MEGSSDETPCVSSQDDSTMSFRISDPPPPPQPIDRIQAEEAAGERKGRNGKRTSGLSAAFLSAHRSLAYTVVRHSQEDDERTCSTSTSSSSSSSSNAVSGSEKEKGVGASLEARWRGGMERRENMEGEKESIPEDEEGQVLMMTSGVATVNDDAEEPGKGKGLDSDPTTTSTRASPSSLSRNKTGPRQGNQAVTSYSFDRDNNETLPPETAMHKNTQGAGGGGGAGGSVPSVAASAIAIMRRSGGAAASAAASAAANYGLPGISGSLEKVRSIFLKPQ
mmetsp:Transcript_14521/g.25461  ORF Transcript_14521/g.25461 Transcript_14521/m.25461 type:complete len:279 (-) Transcript_14521:246-1082(-)